MANFTNTTTSAGLVNGILTDLTGAVTLQLVDGLTLTKTADKLSWADGALTFTITIDNTGDEDYTGVTVTDIIDPLIATLVTDSVTLNGAPTTDYTFDDVSGELVVSGLAPFTVAADDTATVTFQVQKI